MEENKQKIYHKSDWGKQVIYIVLVLAFLFFSYKKNPTKEIFTQEVIREYAVKNGIDTSSSMWLSELTSSIFGGFVEPLIKRNDFILFSTYEVELNNQYINGKVSAIGFWDNIIFYEVEEKIKSNDTKPSTITTEAQLRAKYPCINGEIGVKFSPIVNNKCTVTYSDGTSDYIIINGETATFEDGASICK